MLARREQPPGLYKRQAFRHLHHTGVGHPPTDGLNSPWYGPSNGQSDGATTLSSLPDLDRDDFYCVIGIGQGSVDVTRGLVQDGLRNSAVHSASRHRPAVSGRH
jgi:hypothetical protein